jgi:ATP-dependent exoDNAse (exonuclease V) alpha subunit
MAIYRLEAKIISRGNGHSAVAAAAYRTGTKIRDERADKIHDYSSRTKGVVESVILRPENSPEWTAKTATLWNAVEQGEKRKDAQLPREFILAVPKELSSKEQFQLAVGWAQSELVSKGMIAEVSLHNPKSGKNPHVHILATMRTLDGDKFSAKKPREWNDKGLLFTGANHGQRPKTTLWKRLAARNGWITAPSKTVALTKSRSRKSAKRRWV